MYKSREEFISDNISEKITLAKLSAATRLYQFESLGNGVYSKKTPYIVTQLQGFESSCDVDDCTSSISSIDLNNNTILTLNDNTTPVELNTLTLSEGFWFYDVPSKTLFLRTSQNIDETKVIATYTLFFSDAPVITTWDLNNNSAEIEYENRIQSSPSFKTNVGTDQAGISVANSGTIQLNNGDGYFDDIYDTLVFENKRVEIFSYSRELKPNQSKILFRGNIYDRSFSSDQVTFQVKDSYTRLDESVSLQRLTSSDNVSSENIDTFKRLVYGRVNGHVVKSTDDFSSGFQLSGSVFTNVDQNIQLTAINSQFITDAILQVNDTVEVNGSEYTVLSIVSETELTLDPLNSVSVEADEDSISKIILTQLSGSISSNSNEGDQIVGVGTNFNTELNSGDVLRLNDTYIEIKQILNNNEAVLQTNYPFAFASEPVIKKENDSLDGDVTFLPPNRILQGSATQFRRECSANDTLTVGTLSLGVEKVIDDNTILLDEDSSLEFDITLSSAINLPSSPVPFKNRTFNIAGHSLKEYSFTFVSQPQLNRITLSDVSGMLADDKIEFLESGVLVERAEVRRISGNTITLKQNLTKTYDNTVSILKRPVSSVYISGNKINDADIELITNTSLSSEVTISEGAEFNIAPTFTVSSSSFVFKSGGFEVDILGSDSDLVNTLKPRDYIKAYGDADSVYVEVLRVEEDTIYLRTPYQGVGGARNLVYKSVELIGNSTTVSVDMLGKPKDNDTSNELIEYGPDIALDLLSQTELLEFLNTSSFTEATNNSKYSLGLSIPSNSSDQEAPTIKSVIDRINRTIYGSMTIDSNLDISYSILDVTTPETRDLPVIRFDDIVKWSLKSKGNSLYVQTTGSYQRNEASSSNSIHTVVNDFSADFNISVKTNNIDLLSFHEDESLELTERQSYLNSLSKNEITLESDLRLSEISIGDKLILDLPRLYRRLGDPTSRLKIVSVVGVEISGTMTKLRLSDLGNLYNRTSVITEDTASEYLSSSSVEKTYNSYITQENGTIDNLEETQYINLIF